MYFIPKFQKSNTNIISNEFKTLKERGGYFAALALSGFLIIPVGISSCGNATSTGKTKSPFEQLQDSIRQQGDSIIATLDTTKLVVLHATPEGRMLQTATVGIEKDQQFGIAEDFIVNDSILTYISKEGEKNSVKSLNLKTLKVDSLGRTAEKISFNSTKDSLTFSNAGRTIQTDLTGKPQAEIEPGVTDACMKILKKLNYYTGNGYYQEYMYDEPLSLAGYKGKFTCWAGSKFYGFLKTDKGTIVFKRNGDTFLNDEKIGTTKISISSKYFEGNMRYNVKYIVTGKFTGLDGTEDTIHFTKLAFES
ncbi:MAG: hypothetical protein K2N05_10040 [Muribaculaceae bacterium]|nr:hypothetical protein [Muribaculaceae bacterium]